MINRLVKTLHTILKKRLYVKMFMLYFCFTVIIIISSSFILTNNFNKKYEKEIYKYNRSILTQIQIFSESFLIDKVNSIMVENFLDISQNSAIEDFYKSHLLNNKSVISKAYKNIEKLAINNSFIDSIWIYRNSDDTLISSKKGVSFNITSDSYMSRYINQSLIDNTMKDKNNQKWITPLENSMFWVNNSMITFTQTIPLLSPSNQRLGCIIVHIQQNTFLDSINNVFKDDEIGELIIINKDANVIAHSNTNKLYEPFSYTNYLNKFATIDEGYKIVGAKNNYHCLSWKKSDINDWIYISITPMEVLNQNIKSTRQFTMVSSGIITFFSLIGLTVITTLLYKPINVLIKTTKNKFNIKNVEKNELSFIANIINNLSTQVEEMENILEKHEEMIKYKVMLDLFYGNLQSKEQINQRLKLINSEFKYEFYIVIMIDLDDRIFKELPIEQHDLLIFRIIDIINKQFNHNNICISILYPSNSISTVINFNRYDLIQKNIETLFSTLNKEMGIPLNMCLSNQTNNILKIHNIYTELVKCVKYRFIYGYKNVFTQELIDAYEMNNYSLDIKTLQTLKSNIKSGKIVEAKNGVQMIFGEVKQNHHSYQSTQNSILQIIGLICRVCREQKILEDKLEKNILIEQFNHISSIDECLEWLNNLLDIYEQKIHLHHQSINSEYMVQIKQYINKNIDKQISLKIVAHEFKVSSGHLSKMFKASMGLNFSDYIIEKKFEKAAQLLSSDRTINVSQIAQSLGYLNLPYFIKLFKQRYGLTPLQYRKEHINKEQDVENITWRS